MTKDQSFLFEIDARKGPLYLRKIFSDIFMKSQKIRQPKVFCVYWTLHINIKNNF